METPELITLLLAVVATGVNVQAKNYGLAAMTFCLFQVALMAPLIMAIQK